MPGRAHAMEAHTDELPLDDIAKSVLSHAKLTRDEMKEAIND
jgi:chemotaxis response regulator CheB